MTSQSKQDHQDVHRYSIQSVQSTKNIVSDSPWLLVVDFAAGLWILSFALSILFHFKLIDRARKKKIFFRREGGTASAKEFQASYSLVIIH